ncbi:testis-specific serine threonine-protein kinase [Nesidiocoris tenuis]|uniref:Testis-specific serine threonine-protein kinase n=1 Tax=Nesidiocoris tenuis TaxID=355587 RepID=A0ABN7AX05_9HEMI|nr:testis-specific serine threonine-protein kinase [Nesidiocoris tenuis]
MNIEGWSLRPQTCGSKQHCKYTKLCGGFSDSINNVLSKKGFKLGKTIGEGTYCKVRIAFKASELGYHERVACKVVNKNRASDEFVSKFLPRELSIVRSIKHPNIVTVFNIIESDDQVYMFMDLCDGGDFLDFIRLRGALVESRARHFFRQLVDAVGYLHTREIAHRDLKCENIMLSDKDTIKIADFGFARWCCDLVTRKRVLSDTFCGSAAYAAPEILQGIKYNPKMYDVWSLGCILFIMICGTMPFDDKDIKKMMKIQTLRRLTFPSRSNLSTRVKRLIMHILEPDVTRRATVKQILNSPWFTNSSRL